MTTKQKIKILHVEDTVTDAGLVAHELKKAKLLFEILVVDNEIDYVTALREFVPDILLSDHSLPTMDSWEALNLLKESGINIPFILVTATVSEEYAVSIMKAGAADYILKDRMQRLPNAVLNALEKFKAEAERQNAYHELNRLFDTIDEVFFSRDMVNSKLTQISPACEKVSGYTRDEFLGQPNLWKRIMLPDSIHSRPENHKKLMKGETILSQYQIVHKDKSLRWVESKIIPSLCKDGTLLRLDGVTRDVTERKKSEIAVTEVLRERNTILESIDDAFFAVDKNWVVTYWNHTAEKILSTPKEKILDHNLWEIFSDSIDTESYNKYHLALETNQAVHFEDYYPPSNRWYGISAYPSKTGLSVYFKDVTDRKISELELKKLNENLKKQAKELAISNDELEQFAYVASHDLQEPLRMVTSFLTQLEKKYYDVIDAKGRQYIHFAVDGAKRMRQIILDLLDFSRVGRTEDDLEDVNFNKLVNEILTLFRRQIDELHAQVIFEKLPVIQIHKTPIRQVFQNLISNSLKYHKTGEPPMIDISWRDSEQYYEFAVTDNGIGINSEYFDKIFVIFQRLHNKDEYSGTGMGLAIAKKIIENQGGKIWVESEEGKGSTFYFTLIKNNKL